MKSLLSIDCFVCITAKSSYGSVMPIDHRYHRDERMIIRLAVILGVVVGLMSIVLSVRLQTMQRQLPKETVWQHIETIALRAGLEPEFVYAIAWAESSLNPKARSSVARGMMQITKSAWREVTEESYRHAWDWRTNVRVAVDYMDFCRDFLHQHDAFSYPLLAMAYRYGPYYVKSKEFDLKAIERPKNKIYQMILDGNIRPVVPPGELVAQGG